MKILVIGNLFNALINILLSFYITSRYGYNVFGQIGFAFAVVGVVQTFLNFQTWSYVYDGIGNGSKNFSSAYSLDVFSNGIAIFAVSILCPFFLFFKPEHYLVLIFALPALFFSCYSSVTANLRLSGKLFFLSLIRPFFNTIKFLVVFVLPHLSVNVIALVFSLTEVLIGFTYLIIGFLMFKPTVCMKSGLRVLEKFRKPYYSSIIDLPINYIDSLLINYLMGGTVLGQYKLIRQAFFGVNLVARPIIDFKAPEIINQVRNKLSNDALYKEALTFGVAFFILSFVGLKLLAWCRISLFMSYPFDRNWLPFLIFGYSFLVYMELEKFRVYALDLHGKDVLNLVKSNLSYIILIIILAGGGLIGVVCALLIQMLILALLRKFEIRKCLESV